MTIHSDSELGLLLPVLLTFAAAIALLMSIALVFKRRFRSAAKVVGTTLDVHLFSDANTVKVSFANVSLVLVDERGRRFSMIRAVDTPTAPPYDMYLDPGQSVKTNLAYAVASDAKQLFLIETPRTELERAKQSSIGGKQPPFWARSFGVWLYLAWLG